MSNHLYSYANIISVQNIMQDKLLNDSCSNMEVNNQNSFISDGTDAITNHPFA